MHIIVPTLLTVIDMKQVTRMRIRRKWFHLEIKIDVSDFFFIFYFSNYEKATWNSTYPANGKRYQESDSAGIRRIGSVSNPKSTYPSIFFKFSN